MRGSDTLGRTIGAVVFAIGIGILVFVFALAYGFFTSQDTTLQAVPHGAQTSAVGHLGASALSLLTRIALLLVMAVVGSLVAGRGMQLYFGASSERPDKRQTKE